MYDEDECNGICVTPADLGLPEYGGPGVIAYAHPDCPVHGDPLNEEPSEFVCGGGDESLPLVREEDMDPTPPYYPLCLTCGKPVHFPARTMQTGQTWEHVGHADHKAVR